MKNDTLKMFAPHIELLVFAPYGDSSSQVNEPANAKLTLVLEGGFYGNPKFTGPGITVSESSKRLIEFVRENHGEDVLKTHSFWRASTLREKYEETGVVPWNDVVSCIYHPVSSSPKREMSNQEFDDMWKRERAMEEGMLQGIDVYNEMMCY